MTMSGHTFYQAKMAFDQALINLNYQNKVEFTDEELTAIEAEIKEIVVCHGELAGFIGENPADDKLEAVDDSSSDKEKNHAIARNLLRYILRGSPLRINADDSLFKSPLFRKEIFDSLLQQRDPAIFSALREEFQIALENICNNLNEEATNEEQKTRYAKLLDIIMATYPFLDPINKGNLHIPVKLDNRWELKKYVIKQLNISPHTGPLSAVLEKEDHIYAYGLTPVEPNTTAKPLLIFMGTTFPAGQGAELADLYNFYPNHSVGEGHDLVKVEAWLSKLSNVRVVGHSKGATMSMIAAAKYPDKISQADCFSPAPLTKATYDRLSPMWEQIKEANRPVINAYTQPGDPVSYIGRKFLVGINLFHIIPDSDEDSFYESHIHYFLGRKNTLAIKSNVDHFNQSKTREFTDKVKSAMDYVKFPFQYAGYFLKLCVRKFENFYKDNLALSRFLIGVTVCIVLLTLLGLGILFPPAAAALGIFGIAAIYTKLAATLLTLVTISVSPFLLEAAFILTKHVVDKALAVSHGVLTFIAGLFITAGAGLSMIKINNNDNSNSSTKISNARLNEAIPKEEIIPTSEDASDKKIAIAPPLFTKEAAVKRIMRMEFFTPATNTDDTQRLDKNEPPITALEV